MCGRTLGILIAVVVSEGSRSNPSASPTAIESNQFLRTILYLAFPSSRWAMASLTSLIWNSSTVG